MIDLDWDSLAEFFIFGFIVGEKTMIKGKLLPEYPFPEIVKRKPATLDEIYDLLCDSVDNILAKNPNSAIALSGGYDSRLISGIVAKLGYKNPAITFWGGFEGKLAAKVCTQLGLQHYYAPLGYEIDSSFIETMIKITGVLCGTKNIVDIVIWLKAKQFLDKLKLTSLVSGINFNEILGEGMSHGGVYTSLNELTIMTRTILNDDWFLSRASQSFINYCDMMNSDEICLNVFTLGNGSLTRQTEHETRLPEIFSPVLDTDFLSALYSLPFKERVSPKLQARILKKHHPSLFHLPSTRSYFPRYTNQLSDLITNVINIVLGKGWFNAGYFLEGNRHLILKKLKETSTPRNKLSHLVQDTFRRFESGRMYVKGVRDSPYGGGLNLQFEYLLQCRYLCRMLTYIFLINSISSFE